MPVQLVDRRVRLDISWGLTSVEADRQRLIKQSLKQNQPRLLPRQHHPKSQLVLRLKYDQTPLRIRSGQVSNIMYIAE
jgi:hypothetical protein